MSIGMDMMGAMMPQMPLTPMAEGMSTFPLTGFEPPPMMEPLPPPGDPAKASKKLVSWLGSCLENAKQQTKPIVRSAALIDQLYNGANEYVKLPSEQDDEINERVEIKDAADQIDALKGLILEVLFPNGPPFTATARRGERQEFVDNVAEAMMDALESGEAMTEMEDSVLYYCKHRLGGLKLEPCMKVVPRCRYDEVLNDPMALSMYLSTNRGAQEVPSDSQQFKRFKVELPPSKRMRFTFTNYQLRNIWISDYRRKLGNQHSLHEAHYWTAAEMAQHNFRNLEKLPPPEAATKNNPDEQSDVSRDAGDVTVNFGVYEVWESWVRPPWLTWAKEGKDCDGDDLNRFFEEMGVGPEQGITRTDIEAPLDWWRVFHTKDVILKVSPNYMWDRTKLPYWAESFIPADNKFCGQALAERQSESNAAKNMLVNRGLDNARLRTTGSFLMGDGSGITAEKLKKIFKPRQIVNVNTTDAIDEVVQEWKPEDNTMQIQKWIEFFGADTQDKGVNPAMQGESNTRTATEANINSNRGQVKINESFRRYARGVLMPALKALRDAIVKAYTPEDWTSVLGEKGMIMKRLSWSSPEVADSRMRIEPVATFDYAERQMKAQALTMLMNVFGPFLTPNQIQVVLKLVLKYSRLSTSEVDDVLGAAGSLTDIQDEIRAMATDPSIRPRVQMGDNHEAALTLLAEFLQMYPELKAQGNFLEYMMGHLAALQQQQAMGMGPLAPRPGGAPGGGNGGPPKGPPKQVPQGQSFGGTDGADARRGGQQVSPPDQGAQTAAGFTGRKVKGVPAGA